MKDHHTVVGSLDWTTVRRWKRYRVDLRVKFLYWKDGAKATIFGQGSDVSEGGMAAYVPAEMTVGDNVDIEMVLPYAVSKDPVAGKANLPLGRLPGDISYRGKNVSFYFPLATSILLSIVLSIIFWFVGRR